VHVVLCRAGPGSTPSPPDRAESTNDRRGHHPASDLGAVEIRQARAFACAAAACVRILDRVQVDGETEGVLRPVARPASARRRHSAAAFEAAADITVGRLAAARPIGVDEAHVTDRKAQSVELRKTFASGAAALRLTTSSPLFTLPSKSQYETVSSRNPDSGTGHPTCQN
jgi:hypothetical protein